jgi:hypothetical protein
MQVESTQSYLNPDIAKILTYILENDISKLNPFIDLSQGALNYKELEKFAREEQLLLVSILKKEGIAKEEAAGSVVRCNSCSSLRFIGSYTCNFCKSTNIEKGQVIRHLTCNNIDFDYKFMTPNGELWCDKCNNKLRAIGVDYSKQSSFFKCLKCDSLSPKFDLTYTCTFCGKHLSEDDLDTTRLNAYSLDLDSLARFSQESDYLRAIVDEMRSNGISAMMRDIVVGRSNVPYQFSVVAYDNEDERDREKREGGNNNEKRNFKKIGGSTPSSSYSLPTITMVAELVDRRMTVAAIGDGPVAGTGHNDHNSLLGMIVKFIDVQAANKMLIAIPELYSDEKSILKTYGIIAIEAKNLSEAKTKFIQACSELMQNAEERKRRSC